MTGKGFTDWTNTTKCKPAFIGHRIPRLPCELGFYDTRIKAVMERQIQLARGHGIYGFCFHHYWFSGKPVMRVPYDMMLANPDLDIPFCLHWANEAWTSRWDGVHEKGGVLLAQTHTPGDDIAFLKNIEPALRDKRYIKIDGRPVLVIYRPLLFPDIKSTVTRWNKYLDSCGLPHLYLANMQTRFEKLFDPRAINFDAAIEYPPHHSIMSPCVTKKHEFHEASECVIRDYIDMVNNAIARPSVEYDWFRGVMVGWDNTPRRKESTVFVNSTPDQYGRWLRKMIEITKNKPNPEKRLVFINAWNEWAESAYLEPDFDMGYAFLNETARAVSKE